MKNTFIIIIVAVVLCAIIVVLVNFREDNQDAKKRANQSHGDQPTPQKTEEDLRRVAILNEDQEFVNRAISLIGQDIETIPRHIAPQVLRAKEKGIVQVSWMVPISKTPRPNPPGSEYYRRVIFYTDDPDAKPLILVGGG